MVAHPSIFSSAQIHIWVYKYEFAGDSMRPENTFWEAGAKIVNGTLSVSGNFNLSDFSATYYSDSTYVTWSNLLKYVNLPTGLDTSKVGVQILASINDSGDVSFPEPPGSAPNVLGIYTPNDNALQLKVKASELIYSVGEESPTTLVISDILGREILRANNSNPVKNATYSVRLDMALDENVLYVATLSNGQKRLTRKFVRY